MQGQQLCIPALIAQQFQLLGGTKFNQALMPDNKGLGLSSTPWGTHFFNAFRLGYKTDCQHNTSLTPLNDSISTSSATPYLTGIAGNNTQNFAVPFANTSDYFNPALGTPYSSGNRNPYYNRIASYPGMSTLYLDAKAQGATFIIAWLGMEDIYNYARTGGTSAAIPSSSLFSMRVDSILGGLTANGAKGVIATIPDFRAFPYYTLIPWNSAAMTQSQADALNQLYPPAAFPYVHFHSGNNGFVIYDASVTGGVRQLHSGEYITLSAPLDSMKCDEYGLLVSVMNNYYALDSSEVYNIDNAINSYNAVIMQKAAQYNFALADMHYYFNNVNTGILWNGVTYNMSFVTGGFLSLDGYHPNQQGYALIANQFIQSINSKYNAYIPMVNCTQCNGVLFP